MPFTQYRDLFRQAIQETGIFVPQALVWLVSYAQAESDNPYDLPSAVPEVKLAGVEALTFRQLKAEQVRSDFGNVDASYYRASVQQPEFVIQEGWYAVVSHLGRVITGTIERVDYKLSGQAVLYLNSAENVPFTLEEAGISV